MHVAKSFFPGISDVYDQYVADSSTEVNLIFVQGNHFNLVKSVRELPGSLVKNIKLRNRKAKIRYTPR